MVMQCGVKRKRSYLDSEHQKSLLELSVHKLQEEQAKYGIEPRLLRFVLVNNALKSLQLHMSKLEAEDEFCLFDYEDSFLANTFSHGFLSSPVSPPTPAKVSRFEGGLFSSHSPLVNSSSSSCIMGGVNMDLDNDEVFGIPPPLSPFPSSLIENDRLSIEGDPPVIGTKRTSSSLNHHEDVEEEEEEEEEGEEESHESTHKSSKRRKLSNSRPSSLSFIKERDHSSPIITTASTNTSSSSSTTLTHITTSDDHLSSSSSDVTSSPSSSSLSPIDFSNVDVSLYDFDARAALTLPPVAVTPRNSTPSSLSISSCAMETFIKPLNETSQVSTCNSNVSSSNHHHETNGNISSSSSFTSVPSTSPLVGVAKTEPSDVENLDDIDRIVSLLIT